MSTKPELFKVVLVGEPGVGKSAIMRRLLKHDFNSTLNATIGADFGMCDLMVEGTQVRLQIWDTSGQERFHSLSPNYFRYAHGVFLIFSLFELETISSLRTWGEMISRHCDEDVVLVLLGNKSDLKQPDDDTKERIEKLRTSSGILSENVHAVHFTSAKDNDFIVEAFTIIAEEMFHRRFRHGGASRGRSSFRVQAGSSGDNSTQLSAAGNGKKCCR